MLRGRECRRWGAASLERQRERAGVWMAPWMCATGRRRVAVRPPHRWRRTAVRWRGRSSLVLVGINRLGVVGVTTKSGINDVHVSLFEFLRNEKLDARNFFARTDARKPPFKLNQYGASLGGPVLFPKYNGRNRTFFFVNYEGYREVFGDTQLQTVPVAAIRAGNFAGVKAVYDPLTTRANPAGGANIRDRFPNDLIS